MCGEVMLAEWKVVYAQLGASRAVIGRAGVVLGVITLGKGRARPLLNRGG